MAAAVVLRSMLGASPDACQQACEMLGPENAATVIAFILERAGHINFAGGYLRDLTRRRKRVNLPPPDDYVACQGEWKFFEKGRLERGD